MKKERANDAPVKKTRAARKFEEKFEKLRLLLASAPKDKVGDIFADLLLLLTDSQEDCSNFLLACDLEQFKTAAPLLDETSRRFADFDFLTTLKKVQFRFPMFNLSTRLDVAALAVAKKALAAITRKDRPGSVQKIVDVLYEKANANDPEALYALAIRLYFGRGVERDYAAARKLANDALELGYAPAALFRDLPQNPPEERSSLED